MINCLVYGHALIGLWLIGIHTNAKFYAYVAILWSLLYYFMYVANNLLQIYCIA